MSCALSKDVDPEYIDTVFLQMQPTMPYHVGSYESQVLEPAPKKQRTKQTQKSFADTSETESFRPLRLPCSIRFSELFKEPGHFHTSTQVRKVCFHWIA